MEILTWYLRKGSRFGLNAPGARFTAGGVEEMGRRGGAHFQNIGAMIATYRNIGEMDSS